VNVYGPVHRWSILTTVERDATQSNLFIILQVHATRFRCQPHPSSGVHKTVTTASGTVQLPPSNVANLATLEGGSCTKIWPVQEAVVTVLCTPDDGCDWYPKRVEWTCKIINRPRCVASRWTIINIDVNTELGEVGSCESDMNLTSGNQLFKWSFDTWIYLAPLSPRFL